MPSSTPKTPAPAPAARKPARKLATAGALFVAAAFAMTTGCGSSDPSANTDGGSLRTRPEGTLLPWATGNTWTYRVTAQDGTVTVKVTTVFAAEPVGGTGPNAALMANKVVTTKGVGGTDETVSWQAAMGDLVVRYREQSFSASTSLLELEEHWMPHKLHIDGTLAHSTGAGTNWLEQYQETKLAVGGQAITSQARDRWTVISENESVTVPAGTFEAVRLQKAGGSSTKQYWYAPRVGKVKETGGQTEELQDYSLVP